MTTNKSSRVLVNLLGIPSLLAIILAGDTFNNLPIFSVFITVVLFLGAREITTLSMGKGSQPVIPLLLLFLAILQFDRHPAMSLDIPLYLLILGITLTAMIIEIFRRQEKPLLNISILVFAFVWLGIMLGSLSNLRNLPEIGFKVTFVLFLSVWICDTAAFYFGSKFGKKKILPIISPNKTWVGTIFGYLSSILMVYLLTQFNFFSKVIKKFRGRIMSFEFPKTEVADVEKEINLKEKARTDGENNLPPENSEVFSNCENEAITKYDERRHSAVLQAANYLDPIKNKIIGYAAILGKTHFFINEFKNRTEQTINTAEGRLSNLKNSYDTQDQEVKHFKLANNLSRDPRSLTLVKIIIGILFCVGLF